MNKAKLDLISDLTYFLFLFYFSDLKQEREVEFLVFIKDIAMQKINICYVLEQNNLCYYVMSKLFSMGSFKWLDLAKFSLDKYDNNSSKGCVLGLDLKYLKELL